MEQITKTPKPPYYAVVFTAHRTDQDAAGYAKAAEQMLALAESQPGYLGVETVRDASGLGITVSYWKDRESIQRWRENAEHREAQELGRSKWYSCYQLRIARVESEYGFSE